MIDREQVIHVLQHVRLAMLANKHGSPPGPALERAELELLKILFSPEEIENYFSSGAARIYR